MMAIMSYMHSQVAARRGSHVENHPNSMTGRPRGDPYTVKYESLTTKKGGCNKISFFAHFVAAFLLSHN